MDELAYLFVNGDVDGRRQGFDAGCLADVFRGSFERRPRTRAQSELGALPRQSHGHGTSEPFARCSDKGDAVPQA